MSVHLQQLYLLSSTHKNYILTLTQIVTLPYMTHMLEKLIQYKLVLNSPSKGILETKGLRMMVSRDEAMLMTAYIRFQLCRMYTFWVANVWHVGCSTVANIAWYIWNLLRDNILNVSSYQKKCKLMDVNYLDYGNHCTIYRICSWKPHC